MDPRNPTARPGLFARGGRAPRTPGERVETEKCIFVRKIKARSASITTDRGDPPSQTRIGGLHRMKSYGGQAAIPPQNGSVFPKRTRIKP